jgi:type IV secretory pathway ATPase VirB11/archaellum biosynthesis ATPase
MILKRDVTAGISVRGSLSMLRSTPSWRKRTSRPSSWGSTWMSLAPLVSDSIRIRSTRLITGEIPSPELLASRSSVSGVIGPWGVAA